MDSTKRRLIGVAVAVCGFAVGMAGLLNYFKYRAAADRIVTDRLVVTGRSVENSIQGSLALGLQFTELGTMSAILDRERATDDLIVGIDVFDMDGRMLYSTDRLRANRPAPAPRPRARVTGARKRTMRQPPASACATTSIFWSVTSRCATRSTACARPRAPSPSNLQSRRWPSLPALRCCPRSRWCGC
jgi:hypothetical protein